ncbi:MAG: hypothetical protein WKF84_10455 [Pyrinomonadaceae bacterium]
MKTHRFRLAKIFSGAALFCVLQGCGQKEAEQQQQSAAVTNNYSNANANVVTATATNSNSSIVVGSQGSYSSSGDAINTSKFDAEISRLEKVAEKNPGDEMGRQALASAYLMRANALTGARQYRAALGDYRHVLRYDPDNEEAQAMAATIINIMKTMGREVPAEGEEPAPLQVTPETMPDDAASQAASPQETRNQKSSSKKQR